MTKTEVETKVETEVETEVENWNPEFRTNFFYFPFFRGEERKGQRKIV